MNLCAKDLIILDSDPHPGLKRTDATKLIRELLLSGAFAPGELFTEKTVIALLEHHALSVSRAPLREALGVLSASEQLIEQIPKAGLRLRVPSDTELDELLQECILIEGGILRTAPPRPAGQESHAHLETLRSSANSMKLMSAGQRPLDPFEYGRLDSAFHESLLALCAGTEYVDLQRSVLQRRNRFTLALASRPDLARVVAFHSPLQGKNPYDTIIECVEQALLSSNPRQVLTPLFSTVEVHLRNIRRWFLANGDQQKYLDLAIRDGVMSRHTRRDFAESSRILRDALVYAVAICDTRHALNAALEFSVTNRHAGFLPIADEYARAALAAATRAYDVEDPEGLGYRAWAHYELGRIHLEVTPQQGEPALPALGQEDGLDSAEALWTRGTPSEFAEREAWTHYALGQRIWRSYSEGEASERTKQAVAKTQKALEIFKALPDPYGEAHCHERLARYLRASNSSAAQIHLGHARALAVANGYWAVLGRLAVFDISCTADTSDDLAHSMDSAEQLLNQVGDRRSANHLYANGRRSGLLADFVEGVGCER